jgi:hypothetical protein
VNFVEAAYSGPPCSTVNIHLMRYICIAKTGLSAVVIALVR